MAEKSSSKDVRRIMRYRIGDSVEVHSKEEGFVGSYYAAKVLEVAKNNHVLVEYKSLITDDESTWLRERVHVSEVRPRPQQIQVSNFHVGDEVDAYDNDGWWVGRIISIAESKYYACFFDDENSNTPQKRRSLIDESKYYVYFPTSSRDVFAYPFSRLRLHQEWKNSKWVPSRNSSSFL